MGAGPSLTKIYRLTIKARHQAGQLERMSALLQVMPAGTKLLLLGDKDQLASVEADAVSGDLCRDAASVLAPI